MTTNKPEVVGYRYTGSKSRGKWYYQRHYPTSDNMAVTERGECEALIRLSDYETLQAAHEEELFRVRQDRDAHFGEMMRARVSHLQCFARQVGFDEIGMTGFSDTATFF